MSVQRNLRDLLTVLIACVLQLAAPLSTTAEEASSKRTDLLIERPEDPPGRPALPVPEAGTPWNVSAVRILGIVCSRFFFRGRIARGDSLL